MTQFYKVKKNLYACQLYWKEKFQTVNQWISRDAEAQKITLSHSYNESWEFPTE